MRRWPVVVAVLLACAMTSRESTAQVVPIDSISVGDTAVRHLVRLRDGTSLVGRILGVTADSLRMQLAAGAMVVSRAAVTQVRQFAASRIRNGEYWFENPHATRLLFSSTAFPLEKGTGYYANIWLVMHTFAAGVTDRFTIGGGGFWIPGVSLDETLLYLLPKYTVIDGDNGKVALGALVGILPWDLADNSTWTAGILYGVGTTGTRDSNFSVGLGWGYAGDDLASNPILMVGGQARLARRLGFISENWFFPVSGNTEGIISGGLRFLGEGLSVDLAWLKATDGPGWIPWLGFAFRF